MSTKNYICSVAYCTNPLETPEELDTSLCNEHYKELTSEYYLSLICWNCNRVLETYHRREFLRGIKIPDRYVFTEQCPLCNASVKPESMDFVTIDGSPARVPTKINKSGESIRAGQLVYKSIKYSKYHSRE